MAQIGYCEAAIIALQNASPGYVPTVTGAGTLMALTDPASAAGLEIVRSDGGVSLNGGTNPSVTVKWYTNDNTASLTTPTCNDVAAVEPEELVVEMDMYRQRPGVGVSLDRLQQLCGDAALIDTSSSAIVGAVPNTPMMNEVVAILQPQIRKLVADINSALATELLTRVGFNSRMATPDATAQNVSLFTSATGEKRIDGWATVQQDLQYNEVTGSPIILGGAMINKYARALGWGCCSDGGTDYAEVLRQNGNRFYFDRIADTVFGADDFLVMAPTAAVALSRSRYKIAGRTTFTSGNSEYGSFQLPEFPGFTFDLIATSEGCVTPGTSYILSASFGLYTAPARYGTGDPLNGVNGIFRYNAVSA